MALCSLTPAAEVLVRLILSLSHVQPNGSDVGGQPFCGLYGCRWPGALGRLWQAARLIFETKCDSGTPSEVWEASYGRMRALAWVRRLVAQPPASVASSKGLNAALVRR